MGPPLTQDGADPADARSGAEGPGSVLPMGATTGRPGGRDAGTMLGTVRPDRPGTDSGGAPMRTVRDAVFDVLAQYGVSRMFANPGSTEVDFLTDLTPDVDFVLALHE